VNAQRFVYDPISDTVVPAGAVRTQVGAGEQYRDTLNEYRGNPSAHSQDLRNATLERASRREFSHKRLGSEQRWQET